MVQWSQRGCLLAIALGMWWTLAATWAQAQYETLIASIGSAEVIQTAATLAGPAARAMDTAATIIKGPRQVIEPVFFVTGLLERLPDLGRPIRGVWNFGATPFRMRHPLQALGKLAMVPADLVAPGKFIIETLQDTPKLLGPLKAVESITTASARSIKSLSALQAEDTPLMIKLDQPLF